MKNHNLKHKLAYAAAVGSSIGLLFFFIGASWIGYEAKSLCKDAISEYGGDCVEALIRQLEDDNRGFRARNSAVWALGQWGDSRALPVLEKYYTGVIPEREPLDEVISQYELKKAIDLTGGGANITAFIWRGMVDER